MVSIGTVQGSLLTSFCSAPKNADGGGGLLSLSRCCHDPIECWMDEHYPVVCEEPRWAWGEACVPEGGGR